MKNTHLMLSLLVMLPSASQAQRLLGDMNNSGDVNVADITTLAQMIADDNTTLTIDDAESIATKAAIVGKWMGRNSQPNSYFVLPDVNVDFFDDGTYTVSQADNCRNDGKYQVKGNVIYMMSTYCGLASAVWADNSIYLSPITLYNYQTDYSLSINPTMLVPFDADGQGYPSADIQRIEMESYHWIKNGEAFTLTPSLHPYNADKTQLTWKSSNPTVAKVNESGVVEPLSTGFADIIAFSSKNEDVFASCKVGVETIENIVIQSFENSNVGYSNYIALGEEYALDAYLFPNGADRNLLRWKSSNPEIATVSETGVVKAVSGGKVTITAYSVIDKTIAANLIVDVATIKSISFTYSVLAMKEREERKVSFDYYPANADKNLIRWASSDTSVATVDEDGMVKALSAGYAVITANSIVDESVYASMPIYIGNNFINSFQMNGYDYGLSVDATDVEAGYVWGKAGYVTISNPFSTQHQLVDCTVNNYNQVVFNNSTVISAENGVRGQDNPKDIDGGNPGITLIQPFSGSAVKIEADEDGYVYIVAMLSTHKNYYVFEDGTPIGFTLAMQVNHEAFPNGIIKYTAMGEGDFNEITDVTWTSWPEKVVLGENWEATAGKAGRIGINGLGIIGFPVRMGSTYIVGAGASKIPWCGLVVTKAPCSVVLQGTDPENPVEPFTLIP